MSTWAGLVLKPIRSRKTYINVHFLLVAYSSHTYGPGGTDQPVKIAKEDVHKLPKATEYYTKVGHEDEYMIPGNMLRTARWRSIKGPKTCLGDCTVQN